MRGVTLEARGRSHTLRLSTNAICRAETEADMAIGEIAAALLRGPRSRIGYLRLLVWAGIGGITKDEAGDIIDDIGIAAAGELVGRALKQAFPEAGEGDEGNG
jgi:hypothetical protein